MPMTRLEVTKNIAHSWNPKAFLLALHNDMVEMIKTDLRTCKSAIICHDHYAVADGSEAHAFAFLTINILPGRDQATKEALGRHAVEKLKLAIAPQFLDLDIQYRAHIIETDSKLYFS